jgi:cyclopropane-fatty-acyl-phospholipid synthase
MSNPAAADHASAHGVQEIKGGETTMSAQAIETPRRSSAEVNFLTELLHDVDIEVTMPDGEVLRFGQAPPRCRVTIHDVRALRGGFDELAIGRAYVEGAIDFDGDMLYLLETRARLVERTPLAARLMFLWHLVARAPTRVNRRAIDFHYNLGDEFYLSFIDNKYRFYSHGIFHSDDETLEQSSEHKLETMYRALDLKPGMRLLDIGGGWGGTEQYCGERGVNVTALTIADDSYAFLQNLIRTRNLPCQVLKQDFLTYRPDEPYDAIVIYGVIEHIPNYRLFAERVYDCLKPGGSLYLDGSAAKEKYSISPFTERYIWQGSHSFMALPDVIQEFINAGFEITEVKRETHDYELTMRHWAERFDAARDTIVARWGEQTYRAFRVYLWGGCHAFRRDILQAYHVVVRKGQDSGPRPGLMRRTKNFVQGLF